MNIAYVISSTPMKKIYVSNISVQIVPIEIDMGLFIHRSGSTFAIDLALNSYSKTTCDDIKIGESIALECIFDKEICLAGHKSERIVLQLISTHVDVRANLHDGNGITLHIEARKLDITVNEP